MRRFNSTRRMAVTKTETVLRRRSKCSACGGGIAIGDPCVKLKLKKRFRAPCATCATKPKGTRRYHPACCPSDINAAMGYDPAKSRNMNCGKDPFTRENAGGAVPPPPKPKSAEDLTLEAVAALEKAVIAQMTQRKKPMPGHDPVRCKGNRAAGVAPQPCDVCAEFNKWQGIKQRILRPGTQGEGDAAVLVGLQRLVKMALA